MESFAEVAARAVKEVASDDAVLMDVRRDDEWRAGHAKGALHWDIERLKNGEIPDLPKDKRIYTHCAAGGRASQAVTILKENGFTDVVCMGGLNDWEQAGGELEQ